MLDQAQEDQETATAAGNPFLLFTNPDAVLQAVDRLEGSIAEKYKRTHSIMKDKKSEDGEEEEEKGYDRDGPLNHRADPIGAWYRAAQKRRFLPKHGQIGLIKENANLETPVVTVSAPVEPEKVVEVERGPSWPDMLALPIKEANDVFQRYYLETRYERVGFRMSDLTTVTGLERTHLYRTFRELKIVLKGVRGPVNKRVVLPVLKQSPSVVDQEGIEPSWAQMLDLPYCQAKKIFRKHYFTQHLIKAGCVKSICSERVGLARVHLYRAFKEAAIDIREIARKYEATHPDKPGKEKKVSVRPGVPLLSLTGGFAASSTPVPPTAATFNEQAQNVEVNGFAVGHSKTESVSLVTKIEGLTCKTISFVRFQKKLKDQRERCGIGLVVIYPLLPRETQERYTYDKYLQICTKEGQIDIPMDLASETLKVYDRMPDRTAGRRAKLGINPA